MSTFFSDLHAAMREKEQFKLTLTRDGAELSVVIQPLLGEEPEDLDDNEDAAQVRAALATPLIVRTSPTDFDRLVTTRFAEYNGRRAPLDEAFQALIGSLDDASKNAQVAVQKKNDKDASKKPGRGKSSIAKPNSKPEKKESASEPSVPASTEREPAAATTGQGGLFTD